MRFLLILATMAWLVSPAAARDLEKYCNLQGYPQALRQTLIVIDEHHIVPESEKSGLPENRDWRRFVSNLIDFKRTGFERDFLPRERITLLVARRDGSGLTSTVTGCIPSMSAEERAKTTSDQGIWSSVGDFFGSSPAAALQKDVERFNLAIRTALVGLAKEENTSKSVDAGGSGVLESSLVSSFKRSRAVDLSKGIPRILLYSDLTRFALPATSDVVSARQEGFSLGEQAGLNFERAELYVVSAGNSSPSPFTRDFFHAFFLKTRAQLLDFNGGGSVNNLGANPVRSEVYQGLVVYPGGDPFPMRMRLVQDRNGGLVNSWISVQSDIERFTPFAGVLNCEAETCTFTGDKMFAQIWTTNPNPEPEFQPDMPFVGVRELEFTIEDSKIKGAAYDRVLEIKDTPDNKLSFELTRQQNAAF